ncbi:tetratricopeptide repeat protein [Candidatus Atribacteria bacterium 1244-E10-H5-B2]|nr:MAG: tetratricopeptide repeat protein [Candidatus Atribacteria bacterium 1244-E10-H5-B2]
MKNKYMKHNTGKKSRIFSLIIYIAFSLLFILMVQALPLFGVTAIALASSGPSIYFPEDFWDFGEITPDELPTHIFKFENIGNEVLIIKGIKVSCESCIDSLISTKELSPGDSAELKITVNSLDMIGRFTKRVYVESNDPVNPRLVIIVSGFIKEKNESVVQPQPKPQPQTPFIVGKSYFSQGEYDKAIIEFEKSIELNENHTESYYYLGQCYLQKGIIEYNNKNIFKAYSLYRKANKFAEQVIPQYEKMIEDNPEDLNSYLKLGYIYETRSIVPFVNEYDKALEYYLKALALDAVSESKNTEIYVYLNTRAGSIYYQEKDYSQAIEYLEKAKDMSPQNVEVAYYLGLSYDKIGKKEKAREYLSRVIEIAPQSEFAQEAEKKLKKINKD